MNDAQHHDVIVIGAGVAGLAAAERLGRAGLRVLVVEARNRLGGRIWTLPGPTGEHSIELGAEFVHGKPPGLDRYLNEHNLRVIETTGRSYCSDAPGQLQPCLEFDDEIFSRLDRLKPDDFPDETFERTLSTRFANAPDAARQWARAFVQGFHAADANRISTHSIIFEDHADADIDADRVFHIVGGYSTLIAALATSLPHSVTIRSRMPVLQVAWGRDPVVVTAGEESAERVEEFTAPHVIVTLPLPLLQTGASQRLGSVVFKPPLTEKRNALAKLEMGPVVRITMVFESPFWEDAGVMHGRPLRDAHFVFSRDPGFPTWWTAAPVPLPVLVGWCAGPCAEGKAGRDEGEICEEAIAALARVFSLPAGAVAQRLTHFYFHDWQADPYSRGAYSYVLAGGMGAQQELARPLAGRLFFAGEATQGDGHHATVHGAFDSGRRAAEEVLRATSD
jgi:monoamine oxidase